VEREQTNSWQHVPEPKQPADEQQSLAVAAGRQQLRPDARKRTAEQICGGGRGQRVGQVHDLDSETLAAVYQQHEHRRQHLKLRQLTAQ